MRIPLSKEVEAQLRERASATGQDLESFVLSALHSKLADEQVSNEQPSSEGKKWAAELDAWIASHPAISHFVDDSRESIYDGRGE
jgi:hypothetical protein